jgi:hypothetical protein
MRSQSKGIGSADIYASMCHKIRTILALPHCASHWQDNAGAQPLPIAGATQERMLSAVGCSAWLGLGATFEFCTGP